MLPATTGSLCLSFVIYSLNLVLLAHDRYCKSGNLIFQSEVQRDADIEHLLETQARKRLNLRADFVVRTAKELKTVVVHNPFRDEVERDPGHLAVMYLRSAVKEKDIEGQQLTSTGPEIIRAKNIDLYIVYPTASAGRA